MSRKEECESDGELQDVFGGASEPKFRIVNQCFLVGFACKLENVVKVAMEDDF